jgi:hypothetical protein
MKPMQTDGEKNTKSSFDLTEKRISSSPPSDHKKKRDMRICEVCHWRDGCKKTRKACGLFQEVDMRHPDIFQKSEGDEK